MALIIWDIESYIYRAAVSCEVFRQDKTNPYIYTQCYDLRNGIKFIKDNLSRIQKELNIQDFVIVLGDKDHNFRKDILPSYKANRKKTDKPPMVDIIRKWVEDEYRNNIVQLDNLEGDDCARIIMEDNRTYPMRKVIVGIDKDFLTVSGEFYRDLNKPTHMMISPTEARMNLMKQVIVGDVADNYSGLPNKGQVYADKFVTPDTTWEDVQVAFEMNGSTSEDFLIQRRVATLVSLDNYDFATGQVRFNFKDN